MKFIFHFLDASEALYRIYSVVSYIVVLVVIGLPVWWMTTRVYRAPLPLSKMYDVELRKRLDKPYGLPLSLEYDLLITIVNPQPENLKVNIDGELIDLNLQPFLNTTSSVADFTVKTQWLYLTELGVMPRKIKDYYVLYEYQLPHVITPLETKLWSHISPRPCINLVLYVSGCAEPLYVYDGKNEVLESNSFLSSRWGAISILNPDKDSCKSATYTPKLDSIISLFKKQIRRLLQIKGNQDSDIQEFKKIRIREMVDSTRRTLKSLAQLLSEINSIVISDDVADKINEAVEHADMAEMYVEKGDVDNGLKAAKIAFRNSEAAFSDPSLLALLYFPDDQK